MDEEKQAELKEKIFHRLVSMNDDKKEIEDEKEDGEESDDDEEDDEEELETGNVSRSSH